MSRKTAKTTIKNVIIVLRKGGALLLPLSASDI